jgi:hypothetical protein
VRSLPLFLHDTWLIRHVELGEVELGAPAEASLVLQILEHLRWSVVIMNPSITGIFRA